MRRLLLVPMLFACLVGGVPPTGLPAQIAPRELRTRNMELVGYNGEVAAKTTARDSTVRRRHCRTMSLSHIIANYLNNWPTIWRRRWATSNSFTTFLREGNHEPTRV